MIIVMNRQATRSGRMRTRSEAAKGGGPSGWLAVLHSRRAWSGPRIPFNKKNADIKDDVHT